jgi:selenocysteine lyase/cysteine desulfurase
MQDKARAFSCAYVDSVRLKGLGDRRYYPMYTLQTSSSERPILRRIVLSYGFVSSPPTAVADAIADYYDYLKLGKYDPPLGSPEYALPGEVASMMECPDAGVTFRASTTDCIEDAVDTFIEHMTIHRTQPIARRKLIIMATDAEHPALDEILALRFARVHRVPIRELVNVTDTMISEVFAAALERVRPDLIIFPHIVWNSGLRLPFRRLVREIRDRFPKKQPIVLVDGAHALGHTRIRIAAGEDPSDTVDIYTTCGHKWLRGPHGVGVMYVGPNVAACARCERRLAFGDMFTRSAGLGARASSHQVRTQDRAKAYAFLAAVKDFKEKRRAQPIGEAQEEEFERIRALRSRFLATLREQLGESLVEFTPSPSPETASGILAFGVHEGDEQLFERAKRQLERDGILVDIISSDRSSGLRVCIPADLDVAEIEGVARSIASAVAS